MRRAGRGTGAVGLVVAAVLVGCAPPPSTWAAPQPLPVAADPAQCDVDPAYAAAPLVADPAAAQRFLTSSGGLRRNLVATPDPQATAAGCRVLASGGTAADAVVAAQYVLGLTEPQYSGPGGGGVLVYYDAARGAVETFDGTVHAPSTERAQAGGSAIAAVGVPQTDRLMATLRDRYGTQPLARLVEPARALAADGFVVSERLADAISARPEVLGGVKPPRAGQLLTNPDYADYLTLLADDRRWDRITATLAADPDTGQRRALLADWRAESSSIIESAPPLCTGYRGHRVCGSPSTSTGFMVTAQALGILDAVPLPRFGPIDTIGYGRLIARATAVHLVTEAQRLAFADANTWMNDAAADPALAGDYVARVVTGESALRSAASRIRQQRTLPTPQPVELDRRPHRYTDSVDQGTSQITVRDSAGNLASLTTTLQRSFGSGLRVHGFYLNNSLDNFTAGAQLGEPNRRAPGIRPRTMMSPAMVFDGETPVLALGSPGGRKIPSYVVKTIVGVLDWGLSPAAAVQLPGFGATNRNAVYLEEVLGPNTGPLTSVARLLRRWGQSTLVVGRYDSGLSVIGLDGDRVTAAADYRRHGLALGVDAR